MFLPGIENTLMGIFLAICAVGIFAMAMARLNYIRNRLSEQEEEKADEQNSKFISKSSQDKERGGTVHSDKRQQGTPRERG